jgi:hypothetical protein
VGVVHEYGVHAEGMADPERFEVGLEGVTMEVGPPLGAIMARDASVMPDHIDGQS